MEYLKTDKNHGRESWWWRVGGVRVKVCVSRVLEIKVYEEWDELGVVAFSLASAACCFLSTCQVKGGQTKVPRFIACRYPLSEGRGSER